MTGAFVRVKRDGKWGNVEFDRLTDAELDDLIERALAREGGPDPREGWKWAKFLAAWIRNNVADGP